MQEINLISANAFTLNGETLQRMFTTYVDRVGNVIIKNLIYRNTIDLGNLSDITVNGLPATIYSISKIVYNFSCFCEGDYTPIEEFKIFDATFDKTFE
jgi:hypothetical protein